MNVALDTAIYHILSLYLYLSSKLREPTIGHCYGLSPGDVNNISQSTHLSIYPIHLKKIVINFTKNTNNRPV